MAIFQIPKTFRSGFVELSKLDDNAFQSVLESLKSIPISLGTTNLLKNMRDTNLTLGPGVAHILDSVSNLLMVRDRKDASIEELADDVISLIKKGEIEDFKSPSEEQMKSLRYRIVEMMKCDALYYSAKAIDDLTEHEHIFLSAKFLTDCRPILGLNINPDVNIAVIFHMLQIHYHDSTQHKEMYFALDEDDLLKLREAIDRAERNAQRIRSSFINPSVRVVGKKEKTK